MSWGSSLRLCIFACFFATGSRASDSLIYNDWASLPFLKTIRLIPEGQPNEVPILHLGAGRQLLLSFDELYGEPRSLKFTLLHCTPDWHLSDLVPQDYLFGIKESTVPDLQRSFLTLIPFIHYCIPIPGELNIQLSGNYIIIVYEDSLSAPLLTARMMVVEEKVTVEGRVHAATDIEQKKYRQEVDFTIAHPGLDISNPFEALEVCVFQNRRKDNAICGLKPLYVRDQILDYNYESEIVFEGGNEFRTLDILPPEQRIVRVERDADSTHFFVEKERLRSSLVYTDEQDRNGGYFLEEKDSLMAGYVWVHLELAEDNPLPEGKLYVIGEFCWWNFDTSLAMVYDTLAKTWRTKLLLKQGDYDYVYLWLGESMVNGEVGVVEGTHSETENDYFIYVYFREPGSRYHRLLAASRLSSRSGK